MWKWKDLSKDVIGPIELVIILVILYTLASMIFPALAVTLSSDAGIVNVVFFYLYKFILLIFPVAGTIFLLYYAHMFWLHYIRANFISGITWVLLEVTPPRDVLRSPRAMELFLNNALYHMSEKSGLEMYWQGAVRFWFSLEIASIGGQVRFYIRAPSRTKELLETQMYAAYPQSQVRVVEDYTLAVDKITEDSKWNLWGCEFTYTNPDAYPIKTYVDYGLDKDPKEEQKVDPIAPVVELFSVIGKDEQMWCQIVVAPSKKQYKTPGTLFKTHGWVEEVEEEIKRLLIQFTRQHPKQPNGITPIEIRPPDFLSEITKKASAKMLKLGFDTGIRVCYVAKKEAFNMNNRRNIRMIFRQYAAPNSNELVRVNSTQADAFGKNQFTAFFPLSTKKVYKLADRMLLEYREREFFNPPMRHKIHLPWPLSPLIFPNFFHHHIMVMNTEEIATLWHFPGQILKVPSLERIESKEASPPTNLPI
ncbi:MAG TPA: hypothetical protein VFQ59_00605 [Candidatus Paceibacterota bacterium]|nr:hypothetical protein [Candidatus Paceibacterota bacterium]